MRAHEALLSALLIAAALGAAPAGASAADFPDRPVTLVIPFTPGGANDIFGRHLADALSREWGQPVVVENRAGAAGAIGMAHVSISAPDGYTLGFTSSTLAISAAAQGNLPFDPMADLQPVAMAAVGQMLVVTGKRIALPSVEALVSEAGKQTVFYGTNGLNAATFASELFNEVAGIEMEAVNYKGAPELLTDLGGGRVDVFFGTVPSVLASARSGTVVPVATLGDTRLKALPDVPTIAEAGYPGAEFDVWWGVFGPAGLPEDVLSKLNADINAAMSAPAAADLLESNAASAEPMSVADFTDRFLSDVARMRVLAETRNLAQD
jgi:tripartite-type tricarboxylate transporter receptor subunit TctC